MILEMDNKGAVDLANGWSIGGRTRHMEVRQNFLRELKEQGLLKVVWIASTENAADLYTKNLPGPTFDKHAKVFVGNDCCARLKRAATLSFFAPVCDFFSFLLLWPQSKACKIEWNGELFFFPIVRSLDRETRGTRTTLLHTPRFFSLLFQVKKGQGEGLQQRKESLLNQCHDIFFLFFSFLSSLNSQRSFSFRLL